MIQVLRMEYDMYNYFMVPINLTGRWKVETINDTSTIYFETYKRFKIFKKWTSEKDLEIREIRTCINKC